MCEFVMPHLQNAAFDVLYICHSRQILINHVPLLKKKTQLGFCLHLNSKSISLIGAKFWTYRVWSVLKAMHTPHTHTYTHKHMHTYKYVHACMHSLSLSLSLLLSSLSLPPSPSTRSQSLTSAKFSACKKSSVSARTIGCCMELESSSLAVTLLYRFHRGRSRLRSMAGRGGGLGSSGGGKLSGCRVVSEEVVDLLLGRHSFCAAIMRSRSWMALSR